MLAKRGLLRRHHGDETLEEGSFLDLGAMEFDGEGEGLATARAVVRLAEVMRFDDIHQAAKLAYQGDIVFIDYTSIANDPNTVRRMSVDLKNVAKDLGGDVAGIAKNLLCLTPGGVKIDRQKLRSEMLR
ncbi:MAG TPA: cell division protein SepF [Thermoplasmata archaeon]|nr:cell division protein SepF [Thermoplasmata archaeon]